jgi:hypothetical protein|nr:MAG TPA: hypothetical protein [Caudoviricetes sp.]
MLKNIISKLEAAGFNLEYSLDTVNVKSGKDTVNGEICASSPEESWVDSSVIRALSSEEEHGIDLFIKLSNEKSLKMPDLFILDTDNGMVKLGKSLGFTKEDPSILTGKQLDAIRVKVMGMNPKTYKVN